MRPSQVKSGLIAARRTRGGVTVFDTLRRYGRPNNGVNEQRLALSNVIFSA